MQLPKREVHSSLQRVLSTHKIICRFPKEDPNAPRMLIVKKECPDEFEKYTDCLTKNSANPDVCKNLKEELFICGKPGFKKANTDPTYTY